MPNPRVLVVEDNEDNLILVIDILSTLDYDVISAEDGEMGLSLARREHPDLILMDLSLPKLDGWEVTRYLKKDAELCDIPIIALTAHGMADDRDKALKAGCDDYLTKPINMQTLVAKLSEFLSK